MQTAGFSEFAFSAIKFLILNLSPRNSFAFFLFLFGVWLWISDLTTQH